MALSKAGAAALLDTIMIRCRRMISTPITSTRTLTHSDLGHNLVDASAGDIIINLPPATPSLGAVDTLFRRIDSSAYSVTIVCPGTDKIVLDNPAGVASVLLPGQGSVLEIRANTAGFWYSLAMSASQAVVNAGVDDTQSVSPKKLKFGFQISLTTNGYIIFPTWLGGLIIQWGERLALGLDAAATFGLPTAFPTQHLGGLACIRKAVGTTGGSNAAFYAPAGLTQATVVNESNSGAICDVFWIAIGN